MRLYPGMSDLFRLLSTDEGSTVKKPIIKTQREYIFRRFPAVLVTVGNVIKRERRIVGNTARSNTFKSNPIRFGAMSITFKAQRLFDSGRFHILLNRSK